MKGILHVGHTAGVPHELCREQNRLGIKSDVLTFLTCPKSGNFRSYPAIHWPNKEPSKFQPLRYVEALINRITLLRISRKYDHMHFHFRTALPKQVDLPFWKSMNKKVIMHWHGEIRTTGFRPIPAKFADIILVSTPDLIKIWSAKATWVPNPIRTNQHKFVGVESKDSSETVRIVHATTDKIKKGTKYVERAVKKLKQLNYNVELILVERMTHADALRTYRSADIIVGQLLVGWYGVFVNESMLMGKPVCVHIRPDLEEKYIPRGTLVNSNAQTIFENLRILVEDSDLRKEIGINGRKYVEDMHDTKKVGRQLIDIYNRE